MSRKIKVEDCVIPRGYVNITLPGGKGGYLVPREISPAIIQMLIDEAEMKKAKWQTYLTNAFMLTVIIILFLMAFVWHDGRYLTSGK